MMDAPTVWVGSSRRASVPRGTRLPTSFRPNPYSHCTITLGCITRSRLRWLPCRHYPPHDVSNIVGDQQSANTIHGITHSPQDASLRFPSQADRIA